MPAYADTVPTKPPHPVDPTMISHLAQPDKVNINDMLVKARVYVCMYVWLCVCCCPCLSVYVALYIYGVWMDEMCI